MLQIKNYQAETGRSLAQLLTTFAPFLALLGVMTAAAMNDLYWLTLLLAVPTAGLLVRLFIVQHDCGHGAYFRSRRANDILGRMISVLTMTPYDHWRRSHAAHHATSGNLDRRGQGDVVTMTVEEYQAASPLARLGYRLYRHPLIMIVIGAPVNFIILQRLPLGRGARDRASRRSILLLNLGLVAVFGTAMALFGAGTVFAVYAPVMVSAAWIGGWLFYVQHQYEGAYWERDDAWRFQDASLAGSSFFDLPPVLRLFTGNIGLHHVHHLCSRIPNYRLQCCVEAFPDIS
ncbi:MAG: fatty acid desaturase, partial [Hyphococcus sp.]